jgi:hypothetical protein
MLISNNGSNNLTQSDFIKVSLRVRFPGFCGAVRGSLYRKDFKSVKSLREVSGASGTSEYSCAARNASPLKTKAG